MIRAFVSSTFRDLKEHRAYVIERLERSGIVVDPMEKWTAAGDEPKVLSIERMKDCQLCILLVGFRRGHIPENSDDGLSITQLEYMEAERSKLEVLAFLANEEAAWPAESIAALHADPAMEQWRREVGERYSVGTFTPRPESIDIDAALNRWLQKLASEGPAEHPAAANDGPATIDIRAYSNSEGVLIVWRSGQRIDNCLGFALHRRRLEPGGITEDVVTTMVDFRGVRTGAAGKSVASNRRPIQKFRWFDRTQGEVRYRVVPVMGVPGKVMEPEDPRLGSAWTGWITPRTGQNPQCRASFNGMHSTQALARAFGGKRLANGDALAGSLRRGSSELRAHLGGGLRRGVLELLSGAKMTERRVYAALTDLDDPDVVATLGALGKSAHVILAAGSPGRTRVCRQLREAGVRLYERRRSGSGSARNNFAVVCDRWGTPLSVWSGSAAWTVRALCLLPNNGLQVESVPLARAYLDRWEYFLATRDGRRFPGDRRESPLVHVREHTMSTTVWNSPVPAQADLRDASRLIRGARQGVLFLANGRRFADLLMSDIVRLARDKDLFIEGLSWSPKRRDGRARYVRYPGGEGGDAVSLSSAGSPIDSTIVLVDPFGPHPVVMTGSHDLSIETSARNESDLLIIENVPGLAAEYAVHLLGLFDHYRFRALAARSARKPIWLGLAPNDRWQDPYFIGNKRREFNFLFGSLSPGLDF